jgi:hypothetical protein
VQYEANHSNSPSWHNFSIGNKSRGTNLWHSARSGDKPFTNRSLEFAFLSWLFDSSLLVSQLQIQTIVSFGLKTDRVALELWCLDSGYTIYLQLNVLGSARCARRKEVRVTVSSCVPQSTEAEFPNLLYPKFLCHNFANSKRVNFQTLWYSSFSGGFLRLLHPMQFRSFAHCG